MPSPQQRQWLAVGTCRGPPCCGQERPQRASLAGSLLKGPLGNLENPERGLLEKGGWGRNVRDAGRGWPGRKEEVVGRNEWRMPESLGSPPLPIPRCPGESGISNHLYPLHGCRLGPTLCLSPSSLVGTEIQKVAISLALHCLAMTPNWKCWKPRPSGKRSCARHLSSCPYFSRHIMLCTGYSLCLRYCSCFICPVTSWLSC